MNLNLENINYIVNSGTSDSVGAYVGGLSATASYSTIENVTVTGSVDVDQLMSGTSNVGLLVGQISYSIISNVSVEGSVRAKNNVGGLVGYTDYVSINNVRSNVSLDVKNDNAGNLVGRLYGSTINGAYVSGTIKHTYESRTGSVIGYVSNNNNIESVFSNVKDSTGNLYRPLGSSYSDNKYSNNYSTAYGTGFTQVTQTELMTLMKSNLDPSLWHLGETIVELKDIPSIDIRNISTNQYDVSFDLVEIDHKEAGEIRINRSVS